MKTVSHREAVEAFEELVELTGPDFRYTEICEYSGLGPDGQLEAKCAVARVLHRSFGVSVDALREMDRSDSDHYSSTSTEIGQPHVLSALRHEGGVQLSSGALRVFEEFQKNQDKEVPYGDCLRAIYREAN